MVGSEADIYNHLSPQKQDIACYQTIGALAMIGLKIKWSDFYGQLNIEIRSLV